MKKIVIILLFLLSLFLLFRGCNETEEINTKQEDVNQVDDIEDITKVKRVKKASENEIEGNEKESEGGDAVERNSQENSMETTKELAKKFVESYHYRSPDYDYVEESKMFISEKYYSELSENIGRQTLDREYQEINSIEVMDTSDRVTESHVTWCVYVYGRYISVSGEETESEDMYLVMLERSGQTNVWEVTGSWMNIAS